MGFIDVSWHRSPTEQIWSGIPFLHFLEFKSNQITFIGLVFWFSSWWRFKKRSNADFWCFFSPIDQMSFHYGRTTKNMWTYTPARLQSSRRIQSNENSLSSLDYDHIQHLTYSPGIASADFYLFSSLQHFPADEALNDVQEAKTALHILLPQGLRIFITPVC